MGVSGLIQRKKYHLCPFLSVNSLFPPFQTRFSVGVGTDTRVNPHLSFLNQLQLQQQKQMV